MVELNKLKQKYNHTLKRYYDGCNYLSENPCNFDKYIDKVMQFKSRLDYLITRIEEVQQIDKKEIIEGFDLRRGE